MRKELTLVSVWLICGIISAGYTNAYFARKFDNCEGRQELAFALGMGLLGGPIALFTSAFMSGFAEYGWSLNVLQNPTCITRQPRNY